MVKNALGEFNSIYIEAYDASSGTLHLNFWPVSLNQPVNIELHLDGGKIRIDSIHVSLSEI